MPVRIARLTPGTCGADLSAISNEGKCILFSFLSLLSVYTPLCSSLLILPRPLSPNIDHSHLSSFFFPFLSFPYLSFPFVSSHFLFFTFLFFPIAAIRTARRGGISVSPEDFEDSLRSFFSARGVPLAGMAEAAGISFPSWLKGLGGQSSEALA